MGKKKKGYNWDEEHYPQDAVRLKSVYEHMKNRHREAVTEAVDGLVQTLSSKPASPMTRQKRKIDEREEEKQNLKRFRRFCESHADRLYPCIGQLAYAVPPFLIDSPRSNEHSLPEKSGFVLKNSTTESDLRGISAHRKVGRAFRELNYTFEKRQEAPKKCMFIIIDYMSENYMRWLVSKQTSNKIFSDQSKRQQLFKLPTDVSEEITGKPTRSNSDLIVAHEEKGFVFIQVKSVRKNEQAGSEQITKEIVEATKQLHVDADILRTCLDDDTKAQVTKVVALPNLTHEDFKNSKEERSFRPHPDITFLLSEDLSSPDDFRKWWGKLKEKPVTLSRIKDLVGRYVGVWSAPLDQQPVNERHRVRDFCDVSLFTGRLFKRLLFTKQQIDILQNHLEKDNVYLTGPPGSGKTLMLIQRAKMFLTSCHGTVVVLNAYRGRKGRPVGSLIYENLKNYPVKKERVKHLMLDISDEKDWNKHLEKVRNIPAEYMFLIDEIFLHSEWRPILEYLWKEKKWFYWCAGIAPNFPFSKRYCKTETLTTSIRCPPSVRKVLVEVEWEESRKQSNSYDSSNTDTERGTEGPSPLCIRHELHGEHPSQKPVLDCTTCAEELASLLQHKLKLIHKAQNKGPSTSSAPDSNFLPCSIVVLYSIPRDQYHDDLNDVEISEENCNGYMAQLAESPFIKRLKKNLKGEQINLLYTVKKFDEDFMKKPFWDNILVSWVDTFQGLERDVVVYLPSEKRNEQRDSRKFPVPGVQKAGVKSPHRQLRNRPEPLAKEPPPQKTNPREGSSTSKVTQHSQPSTSKQRTQQSHPERLDLANMMFANDDLNKYSDWDKLNLFLAASRCCAQLIMMVP